MSFNITQKQSAPVDLLGGLVTISKPEDVSEGSSPRTHDMDPIVGSSSTRGGLVSVYAYDGEVFGPRAAHAANDNVIGGTPWQNPNNILVEDGNFATEQTSVGFSFSDSPTVKTSVAWANPANISNPFSSYATITVTVPTAPLTPAPVSAPTPPFKVTPTFSVQPSSGFPFDSAPIFTSGYNLTSFGVVSNTTISGFFVVLKGFATGTAAGSLGVQLTQAGVPVGEVIPLILPPTATVLSINGGLWGAVWTPETLATLGVNIVGVATGLPGTTASISVNSLSVQANCVSPNFADPLNVQHFNLALTGAGVTGIMIRIKGQADGGSIIVQLLNNTAPIGLPKTVVLPVSNGFVSLGSSTDTWDTPLTQAVMNSSGFGVTITTTSSTPQNLDYITMTAYQTYVGGSFVDNLANFNYIKTMELSNGTIDTLALDANGVWWQEDAVNNPGILTDLDDEPILAGSYAQSVTQFQHEYICFSNLLHGTDVPRQYNGRWWDRISQVGPGSSPNVSVSTTSYAIVSITQDAPFLFPIVGFPYASWAGLSSGGGLASPGNIVSIFLRNGYTLPPDIVVGTNFILSGFANLPGTGSDINSGGANPAFWTAIFVSQGPGTGGADNYCALEFVYPQTGLSSGTGNQLQAGSTLQVTAATLITSVQVPNLEVGGQFQVSGASVAGYDGTHVVTATPNAGQFSITDTSLTSNEATYAWSLLTGVAPLVGQLVTVKGTTNGNGIFNVTQAPITTVTGVTSGTFTIDLASAVDISPVAESGTATVSGNIFVFDPLVALGSSTGGSLSLNGQIASGTRQCVVMFLTRNNYLTRMSMYPTIFTTSQATDVIVVNNVPTGPPDTIARWIAFTEAGANGVPGALFYVIPTAQTINGVKYTSTVINDNTTTTATFSFIDQLLLNSLAVNVEGQQQDFIDELGSCAWVTSYAGRNFYGLEQNKVQNFNNTTFDGGTAGTTTGVGPDGAPITAIVPAGWTVDPTVSYDGTLGLSSVFGNSFYVQNVTGSAQTIWTRISQGAAQDNNGTPIIDINITYSVRITARIPSNIQGSAAIVIDLHSAATGLTYGTMTLPFSSLTNVFSITTLPLLTTAFTSTVPPDLQLRVYSTNIGNNADYEIDRFEVFPTESPMLGADVSVSYFNNVEAIAGTTGSMGLDSQNLQNVYGAAVVYDNLYFLKESSMFSTQDSAGQEPSGWSIHEVSNKVGTCGIHAFDYGADWLVTACRNGIYVFSGGAPTPIMKEIFQIWEAINWSAGHSIWVRNDLVNQRILVGIPLPTPNFWLPDAPVNAAPTSPNVMLALSILGMSDVSEITSGMAQRETMFATLVSRDMARKWNIWQIPSPYADLIKRGDDLSMPLFICNGNRSSKIYKIDPDALSDDGQPIHGLYTTYGFVDSVKSKELPLLGFHRKLYTGLQVTASGSGTMNIRLLPNSLSTDTPYTAAGIPLTEVPSDDYWMPLNVAGNRAFIEFSTNAIGAAMDLSKMILVGKQHPWQTTKPNTSLYDQAKRNK